MDKPYHYQGDELALFGKAINWKRYFGQRMYSFIGEDVLEVGAGKGSTSKVLNQGKAKTWTMLEPDETMFHELKENFRNFPGNTNLVKGNLENIDQCFDTILYIDVLEHIEQDKKELESAAKLLKSGGHLIVLSPAYQFLFNEFDSAIGHYRRYNRKTLKAAAPQGMNRISISYMDSTGFFASLMNRLFLHQSYPTQKQVEAWDKYFIPVSKITDALFLYSFGKTILGIWEKK